VNGSSPEQPVLLYSIEILILLDHTTGTPKVESTVTIEDPAAEQMVLNTAPSVLRRVAERIERHGGDDIVRTR